MNENTLGAASPLLTWSQGGARCELHDPIALPNASAFLWNRQMMIQVSCRGYAVARHMQPEPARYAHAPNLEAAGFMQPEQPYYAHHPGRFVYLRDDDEGSLHSIPHEPVRRGFDRFRFSVGRADLGWELALGGLRLRWSLRLPGDDAAELWSLEIENTGRRPRRLSLYPYFSIGYMSWMHQGARHRAELGALVASSVTPYQRVEDWPRIRTLKDRTVLLYDRVPDSWETRREAFEGEGGLHAPDALRGATLACGEADYETPLAVLQYRLDLAPGADTRLRFVFAPARDDAEIARLRQRHLAEGAFEAAEQATHAHLDEGRGALQIETPDADLDAFVNHWLARQVYYHGDVNRLTTDPQTRNYLQDAMGMSYLRPERARAAFLFALAQQQANGAMPDGILLHETAELKYINRVPHTDHCVWLPVCLQAYLDETGDDGILDAVVIGRADGRSASVYERITAAMRWLLSDRDARGLSYIAQGDWCDPMNMVGHRGLGVSGWLSIAVVHALRLWIDVAERRGDAALADEMRRGADAMHSAVRTHLWDGAWFARGITDDNVRFGIAEDREGRIFLNPQSWALMAGIADPAQCSALLAAIDAQLETPYGVEMLGPPYTAMREDVGRVTQKYPGSAENGSVYNHAAAFYLHALYGIGDTQRAWRVLRRMIPGPDESDLRQRGQLPVFIPNYYRGAWRQLPRTAGRSSQLFNTGTVSWVYRALLEGLFGVKGTPSGLRIAPQLPQHWNAVKLMRRFRGADFDIHISRGDAASLHVNGTHTHDAEVRGIRAGSRYRIDIVLGPA